MPFSGCSALHGVNPNYYFIKKKFQNIFNIASSESFKFKARMTGRTPSDGNTKDVEIVVSLKYLSNVWSDLEMPLINCEIDVMLTWSVGCIITNSTGAGTFATANRKLYALVVTLSTQRNTKLLQKLNLRFKGTIS